MSGATAMHNARSTNITVKMMNSNACILRKRFIVEGCDAVTRGGHGDDIEYSLAENSC
jgi:hypothetical protein